MKLPSIQKNTCGEERTRTDNLLLAKQTHRQLCYFPKISVSRAGVEPAAHSLEGCRSVQLSYREIFCHFTAIRKMILLAEPDLNQQPLHYQCSALTN